MNLAVIPARGGSKRIPKKNIKVFNGKPIIEYAIQCAIDTKLFRHIIVSTDNVEIAEIAKNCGAEVPFVRPSQIADDYTPTVPVVSHAISECIKLGLKFEDVCCIYPCVPFIEANDVTAARELLISSNKSFCLPVAEFPSLIQRGFWLSPGGDISQIFPEHELTRTQDLENSYFDAGQFYWGRAETWLQSDNLDLGLHSNSVGYRIPMSRVVDIDTESDWCRAEIMAEVLLKRSQIL